MHNRGIPFLTQSRKHKVQNDSQGPPVKLQAMCNSFSTDILPATALHVTVPNRQLQHLFQFQNFVTRVLSESAEQILSRLCSFASPSNVTIQFSTMTSALEVIVSELNSLPVPYANAFPDIIQDTCASSRCHPLLLHTLKPVQTTDCMYNALSLTLTGTEYFRHLIRLLCAYALVKYKETMISAFSDAFPSNTQMSHEQMYERALADALQVNLWGSDYQLFPFSLLINRPMFHYNTFFTVSETSGMMILTPSDTRDAAHLLQQFLAFHPDTRCHVLYCSNVHRALLASGGLNALPNLPLCLFNVANQHWVAMLLL